MADDDGEDDELDSIWNPAKQKASPLPKKSLELVVSHGQQPYAALETKDKVLAFVVRSLRNGFRYSFAYHTLSITALHDPKADILTLITDRGVIDLYGRNLLPVAVAFEMHTAYSVTEFSPEMHLLPSDKTAPFIERIEVMLPRPPQKPERVAKADDKLLAKEDISH
ncbi:MAG: hypothetical protein CV089_08890 [Nitrospira sp. WS110]|nr:hypothetical protein [Nitrospira sp. WS110]